MQLLKHHAAPLVEDALEALGVDPSLVERMLNPARESDQGDLSLPCFPFAKALGMAPAEIAQTLCETMGTHEAIQEINAVNGYLNIKANPAWLAKHMLEQGLNNGVPSEQRQVLIEHTSANPNGPFHVGRARNAILGDTLVRLHRLWGNEVTAEYYVDDMGKQVAVLAWALEKLDKDRVESLLSDREPANPQWVEKADHQRVRWYQAAQILRQESEDAKAIENAIGELVHASEHGDEVVLKAFEAA